MYQVKDFVPSQDDLATIDLMTVAAGQGTKTVSSYDRRRIKLRTKTADSSLEILFLGDTSFGENYQQRLEESGKENILKSKGYDYPLQNMAGIMRDADLVVANLETPITDCKTSPFSGKKSYIHWTDTVEAPVYMHKYNIRVVGLANNHTFDYGTDGFTQTLAILEQEQFCYFGAGRNQQEASEPFLIEAELGGRNFSCAIIGAFEESIYHRRDFRAYAEDQKGGICALNIDAIIRSIVAIKAYNPETFVIIFPHWGNNYEWKSSVQTKLARSLIDAGADLILGHGAHMLQELEHYHDKWIAYSIGNFMFNSPGRYARYKAPPYSMLTKLIVTPVDGELSLACRCYPIVTDNKQTQYQPSFVTESQFSEVCELLVKKTPSQSAFVQKVITSKDQNGYYLQLPLSAKAAVKTTIPIAQTDHPVGFICNTQNGIDISKRPELWMYRAVPMSETLKKHGIELFIYAFNEVDADTGTVRGYVIENNQFVEKISAVPSENYDWFIGSKASVTPLNKGYKQVSVMAKRQGINIYPNKVFRRLAGDKLRTYNIIADFDSSLAIYTEIYKGKRKQIQAFLDRKPIVFLKPQFGSMGIGIIVIIQKKDKYILNFYQKGREAPLSFDNLADAHKAAKKIIADTPYVVQTGIKTAKIADSTFDIRIISVGRQGSWQFFPHVRIGAKYSDLSNISQGGTYIELEDLVDKLALKTSKTNFVCQLCEKVGRLSCYLDAFRPSQMLEIAFDIILDNKNNLYITEINTKPGSPMILSGYNNMFKLSQEEHARYTKHLQPHGVALANALYHKWLENKQDQPSIWFDAVSTPLSISDEEKIVLLQEIQSALKKRRPLIIENIPQIVANDTAARMVFLSISNGFSKAQVAMGSGLGMVAALKEVMQRLPALFKEAYQPIWMKLDIVTESITHKRYDLSLPVNFDRSLNGIAFAKTIDIAFLPEQLNTYTLIRGDGRLHLPNIQKAIMINPYLHENFQRLKSLKQCTLYQFTTQSCFYSDGSYVPLYRGHRLFTEVIQADLLNSIDFAASYLMRSIDLNGKFNYSYEPKKDCNKENYNILRHSGTLYSLLEVYELTRSEKILVIAQRAIHYLLEQVKDLTINNHKTLVVVESGNVKLGGNALAALALTKYCQVTGDRSYLPYIQMLAEWILSTQNDKGEYTIHKQAYTGEIEKKFTSEYYPGETLFALVRLYQLDPQQRWLDSAIKGAAFLINVRDKDLPENKLIHDHWLLYALNEIHLLHPNESIYSHAMKITNVIISSQRKPSANLDWVGGFYNPPRSTPTATRIEGLCAGYHLAGQRNDLPQQEKMLSAIKLGIAFQLQTQFLPESAMYLANPQQAMGGFHHSLTNFEIRIDYVQHNISSLLSFYNILNLL
jgi:glutathione synthase/RimK-type ligase-like ATP-grasp enzyme